LIARQNSSSTSCVPEAVPARVPVPSAAATAACGEGGAIGCMPSEPTIVLSAPSSSPLPSSARFSPSPKSRAVW
jgi:hypothetical protein